MTTSKQPTLRPLLSLLLLPGLLLGVGLFAGCKTTGTRAQGGDKAAAPSPTIDSFWPTRAVRGATLRIRGSGFGPLPSENSVRLNGVLAALISAGPHEIAVEVPDNSLATGLVEVSVNGKTARSATPFTYVPTVATVSTLAEFYGFPVGIAMDKAGNFYIADADISKITPDGKHSTSGAVGRYKGSFADAQGSDVQFNRPAGIAIDKAGNLYVADSWNHRIRKITPTGEVSTFAGSGEVGEDKGGFADGPGSTAQFNRPSGIAIDTTGNLYVTDSKNHRIRKITPKGEVSTFAGSGETGKDREGGYADGPGSVAQFSFFSPAFPINGIAIVGLAIDAADNLYVADLGNHRIRKITPTGEVSTLAGSGEMGEGKWGGYADGPGSTAQFSSPSGVTIDTAGNLYVADAGNNLIRKITPTGEVSTLAGSGKEGYADGAGSVARFYFPRGIAIDAAGTLYVVEGGENVPRQRIRKIVPKSAKTSVRPEGADKAGASPSIEGFSPSRATHGAWLHIRGEGFSAALRENSVTLNGIPTRVVSATPTELKVEVPKNKLCTGLVQVNVKGKTAVSATPFTYVLSVHVSTFAGSGEHGHKDGIGTAAQFGSPSSLAIDAAGNLYVADSDNNLIRKITPKGEVSTFAKSGEEGQVDSARFDSPDVIAIDKAGNLYASKNRSDFIRKITPKGEVSTFAEVYLLNGMATDAAGNLYVMTRFGNIQKISPEGREEEVSKPSDFFFSQITAGQDGNLYTSWHWEDSHVLKITPEGEKIYLLHFSRYDEVEGTKVDAWIGKTPEAVDAAGNLYLTDGHRILRVTPEGVVSLLAGSEESGYLNGPGNTARFGHLAGMALDAAGNLYVADAGNHRIRKIVLE